MLEMIADSRREMGDVKKGIKGNNEELARTRKDIKALEKYKLRIRGNASRERVGEPTGVRNMITVSERSDLKKQNRLIKERKQQRDCWRKHGFKLSNELRKWRAKLREIETELSKRK